MGRNILEHLGSSFLEIVHRLVDMIRRAVQDVKDARSVD